LVRDTTNRNVVIGAGNTLRLGEHGGVLRPDIAAPHVDWTIGTSGVQNAGTLTAGGAPNTPGEIDLTIFSHPTSSGTLRIDSRVTDNGIGAVTLVKAG